MISKTHQAEADTLMKLAGHNVSQEAPAAATAAETGLIERLTELRDKHSSPTGDEYTCGQWDMAQRLIETVRAATPSPAPAGGEVRVLREALEPFRTFADHAVERVDGSWVWSVSSRDRICDWFDPTDFGGVVAVLASLPPSEAAQAGEAHPDDAAVDRFAAAMKTKLAAKREDGRRGWWDDAYCDQSDLSRMLREHVEKGDPLDVGNLAMMLHQREERIRPTPAPEKEPTDAQVERAAYALAYMHWPLAPEEERIAWADKMAVHYRPSAIATLKAARLSDQPRVSEAMVERAILVTYPQFSTWTNPTYRKTITDHYRRILEAALSVKEGGSDA